MIGPYEENSKEKSTSFSQRYVTHGMTVENFGKLERYYVYSSEHVGRTQTGQCWKTEGLDQSF